jgi:hypothetical protein
MSVQTPKSSFIFYPRLSRKQQRRKQLENQFQAIFYADFTQTNAGRFSRYPLNSYPEFADLVVMPCTHEKTRAKAIHNGEEVIEMYLEAWQVEG